MVTIALLFIFATVSTAIVWIVMQTFQTSRDMSLNSQRISQTQKILHSTAEVVQNIELIKNIAEPGTRFVLDAEKHFTYSGGAQVNNMNAGIPFNDATAPSSAVRYDMSAASKVMIYFRL